MRNIRLSAEETRQTGFTHKWIISFADGDFTAAAVTQTYNLMDPLPAGHVVKDFALRRITLLSGGAVATATVQAGKTGTVNAYLTASDVFTGSAIVVKGGDGASFNQAGGDGISAASALVAVVTTTTANVAALTAGEFHLFATLVDLAKL